MARNIAARRAAKAQRRKAIVAQKRQVEIAVNSVSGQVRAAQVEPIQHCLLSDGLFESGIGMLLLARGPSRLGVTAGVFLLDTSARGAKDVFLRSFGGYEFDEFVERMSLATPMLPVDPSHARKLLHDLVTWSREAGFAPHADYAKIEAIFGSVYPAACDTTFEFGRNGKPLLIGDLPGLRVCLTASDADLLFEDEADFEGTVVEVDAPSALDAPNDLHRSDDRAAA